MSSIDSSEIARFAAAADHWWDARGPFRALHKFNPARLALLRLWIERHFGLEGTRIRPFDGLTMLDVGCGGGLVSEPMARLGASVLGIDAAQENIAAARAHGATQGSLSYEVGTAEALAAQGRQFDVVLAMEIIEHVADRTVFLDSLDRLLAPRGLMVIATLNRTAKSFALAIVGAEYVLNWVPRGTHDWKKFIGPDELANALPRHDEIWETTGLTYKPLLDRWGETSDLSVNYMAAVRRRER